MSWVRFTIRRLGLLVVTLFIVSVIIFAITEVIPGDIARIMLGQQVNPESVAAIRKELGLDRPAYIRYLEWISDFVRGDLGESWFLKQPIDKLIAERLKNSLVLAGFTFLLATPLGLFLGIVAGLNEGRWVDRIITNGALLLVAIPRFAVAIFLVVIFADWLALFPPLSMMDAEESPLANLNKLVLPVLAITSGWISHIAAQTRASLIEVMKSSYIRTAILKGLNRYEVIYKHALRNALLPTITVLAWMVGATIGYLIIIEFIFAYPGMGRLLYLAITKRDLPLLQATALFIGTLQVTLNFLADILYVYFNPRIRYT